MSKQPIGDVSFLFTDIEGSSRLWERFPDAMPSVLARHNDLLQQAVDEHGGHTFKTIGDAFCVAFPLATEAVAAATDAQLVLGAEDWLRAGAGFPGLAVRMGVHCGPAHAVDDDYIGRTLNRAARIMSAGHGGQILLSNVVRTLTDGELPPGCAAKDLGVHALRDLAEPEKMFQLVHPKLRHEFPELNTLESLPNNLPSSLSSFVGRRMELRKVQEMLDASRLVTLTGPGGCGKTRLALQVAADALADFPNGVWMADFASLRDASLVASTVASALGLPDAAGQPTEHNMIDHLKTRNVLLVFDNCEHLIDECAGLAFRILSACPAVRILATSRQTLSVPGEHVWPVAALTSPSAEGSTGPASLASFESVQLFHERARARHPAFEITEANAAAVARICRSVEGIPLAIELAAARIRVLSAEQLDARLEKSLLSLTGGWRTGDARHESLRKTIDWSYGLLCGPERHLFNRLSVFAGGFSLETAISVCGIGGGRDDDGSGNTGGNGGGCESAEEALELLGELVDQSLVATYRIGGTGLRYRLPEVLRQYALEKLDAAGDYELFACRHADAYREFAAEAAHSLTTSGQVRWFDSLEIELDNLRGALGWYISRGAAVPAQHLSASLWRFWTVRGHLNEGSEWLGRALTLPSDDDDLATRARAHNGAGCIRYYMGDYGEAQFHFEANLALSRRTRHNQGVVDALNNLATVAMERGQFDSARVRYEECLPLQLELGDEERIASIYYNLGSLHHGKGDLDAAAPLFELSLEHAIRAGDERVRADAIVVIGDLKLSLGQYEEAEALHRDGLAIYCEIEDSIGCADALLGLGTIGLYTGDYTTARAHAMRAHGMAHDADDMDTITEALDVLGEIDRCEANLEDAKRHLRESVERRREVGAVRKLVGSLERHIRLADAAGNPQAVMRLSGAVAAQRRAAGMSPAAVRKYDREALADCFARARSALGEDLADGEFYSGKNMTLDAALDYALASV